MKEAGGDPDGLRALTSAAVNANRQRCSHQGKPVRHGSTARPARSSAPACHRLAAVHRLGPRPGHRPVQGRGRRLFPVAERAAALAAGRVAGADHRGTGRLGPRAPTNTRRPVRGQSDRAQDQQPARGRHGAVRQIQGAGGDNLAGRARGCQPGRPRLGRRGDARRDLGFFRSQGDRERRRRFDPGRGRRRGAREPAFAVRDDPGVARVVRWPDRAVRRHRHRRCDPGRAGHGRGPRLHRLGLHRDEGGECRVRATRK